MPTYSKELLSGSTNGRPIKVTATSSAGTILHTASSTSGVIDEVWLYATNPTTEVIALTVEWGGTTADDRFVVGLPPIGASQLLLVAPGFPVNGGVVVRAFGSESGAVVIGYVNKVSP